MVYLDLQTLIKVKNSRTFKTNVHWLFNQLNYESKKDASQDLLHYYSAVKLKNMDLRTFKEIWENTEPYTKKDKKRNRKYLEFQITYARQDLILKNQKYNKKQKEVIDTLKFNYVPALDNKLQERKKLQDIKDESLSNKVLDNLDELFLHQPKKKKFIKAVLNSKTYKYPRTIDEKLMLKNISKYCDMNRDKFNKILERQLSNSDKKTLNFIYNMIDIEESNLSLSEIQDKQAELINRQNKLFEDLIGLCGEGKSHYITHQKHLLNNWNSFKYQDEKAYLIEYLYIKKDQLENKLK